MDSPCREETFFETFQEANYSLTRHSVPIDVDTAGHRESERLHLRSERGTFDLKGADLFVERLLGEVDFFYLRAIHLQIEPDLRSLMNSNTADPPPPLPYQV